MEFKSINPHDKRAVGTHVGLRERELDSQLTRAGEAFEAWRQEPLAHRTALLARAAAALRDQAEDCARMMSLEMGKPIREARGEVEKCAWVCEYYAQEAEAFLQPQTVATNASQSFVRNDPMGAILAIMPWNFPFWQVFRFAAPALTAGNTAVLKHASNVFGCAKLIEGIFRTAGYPEGTFTNLVIHHDSTESIIAHRAIRGVTLTGSERAGVAVGTLAGKHLKKAVLELGGSNAFIVWNDADVDRAVETGVKARMMNSGQSCIAAKRFIVLPEVYDAFVARFTEKVAALRAGDPLEESTDIGPLAREDLAVELQRQLQESVAQGARVLTGGQRRGAFFEPTVLVDVDESMPAATEETFGPLAVMIRACDEEEAFNIAARSRFGLGLTVCTRDVERALSYAGRVRDGAFFVNQLVMSDPRLPFGGTGASGYGRELARDGMMEFVNRKTVYVA